MRTIFIILITFAATTVIFPQSWEMIKGTKNATGFYFINEKTGWVLIDNYDLYKTTDGGINWKMQVTEGSALDGVEGKKGVYEYAYGNRITSIYFFNEKKGIIGLIGYWGTVNITEDGGNTWNSLLDNNTSHNINDEEANHIAPLSFHFFNEKDGFACGRSEGDYSIGFYKTFDGGNSYRKVDVDIYMGDSEYYDGDYEQNSYVPYDPDLDKVYFFSSQLGWAIGNRMNLQTHDGGITWSRDTSRSFENLCDIWYINDTTGWILAEGGILYTEDAGKNYKMIYEDSAYAGFHSILFLNEKTGYMTTGSDSSEDAQGRGELLETADGGYTWETVLSGDNAFTKFQYLKGEAILAGGKNGIYILKLK